jgi:hypothetical protein
MPTGSAILLLGGASCGPCLCLEKAGLTGQPHTGQAAFTVLLVLALWHSALTWFEHVSSGGLWQAAGRAARREAPAGRGGRAAGELDRVGRAVCVHDAHTASSAGQCAAGWPDSSAQGTGGMVFKGCADTAVLLFGSNEYTRPGQGQPVESDSPILLLDTYLPATNDTAA